MTVLAACTQPEAAKLTTTTEAQPAAIQSTANQAVAKAETKPGTAAGAQPAGTKRYPLTGRVVWVDKLSQSINVDGDEIPGFMAAMQMPYPVKDATVLDKVAPGNRIKAEIVMGDEGAYLENIVIADNPPAKLHIK